MALSLHPQASRGFTDKTTEIIIVIIFCLPPETFSSIHHLLPLDQFAAPENDVNIGRFIYKYLSQSVNIR